MKKISENNEIKYRTKTKSDVSTFLYLKYFNKILFENLYLQ